MTNAAQATVPARGSASTHFVAVPPDEPSFHSAAIEEALLGVVVEWGDARQSQSESHPAEVTIDAMLRPAGDDPLQEHDPETLVPSALVRISVPIGGAKGTRYFALPGSAMAAVDGARAGFLRLRVRATGGRPVWLHVAASERDRALRQAGAAKVGLPLADLLVDAGAALVAKEGAAGTGPLEFEATAPGPLDYGGCAHLACEAAFDCSYGITFPQPGPC